MVAAHGEDGDLRVGVFAEGTFRNWHGFKSRDAGWAMESGEEFSCWVVEGAGRKKRRRLAEGRLRGRR
jgi:hypothetical protein